MLLPMNVIFSEKLIFDALKVKSQWIFVINTSLLICMGASFSFYFCSVPLVLQYGMVAMCPVVSRWLARTRSHVITPTPSVRGHDSGSGSVHSRRQREWGGRLQECALASPAHRQWSTDCHQVMWSDPGVSGILIWENINEENNIRFNVSETTSLR